MNQLIKKKQLGIEKIYPKTYTNAISDKDTGLSLEDILSRYNCYFLTYNGSKASTRKLVPDSLRRAGLIISYVKFDNTAIIEVYQSNNIDDTSFTNDNNWKLLQDLVGTKIEISLNGTWVINGIDTGKKAVGSMEYPNNEDWKLLTYNKILCIGDSVTQGFVVESDSAGNNVIYGVQAEYSYPVLLNKLIPYWEITNGGLSGISPYAWVNGDSTHSAMMPNYVFSEYDLFIIELGYNSKDHTTSALLNPDDKIAYETIISTARNLSPNSEIFLVLSSNQFNSNNWVPFLNELTERYSCKILDLRDKNLLDLSQLDLHGKDVNGNWDLVHFNRKGYAAKAFYIKNKLTELL